MIVCVCPSPAIDVTYHVGRLVPGATARVRTVAERPGGKAVNVARVLHQLGEPVLLVAPVGGATGQAFADALSALGVPSRLVPTTPATRRTVTVVDEQGLATCLAEAAAVDRWPELLASVTEALPRARALVVSGSLPSGVPDRGLGELVRRARDRDVPVVADTHGPALLEALAAGADVVKPNADELAEVTHDPEPATAARELSARHDAVVVVSRGESGVLAATPSATWEARPGTVVTGNPTGAGDALVAALARGLARDPDAFSHPDDLLRDAVALSVAAVRSPTAGDVDLAAYAEELPRVGIARLERAG